jgi:hypothetical protein
MIDEVLDLRGLEPAFDALLQRATSADRNAWIREAMAVLLRLRKAPPVTRDDPSAAWIAVRTSSGEELTITCWSEQHGAVLVGIWRNGMLESLSLSMGDRIVATRMTSRGESRFSDDAGVEGPADRRDFGDLEARSREALQRWNAAHPRENPFAAHAVDAPPPPSLPTATEGSVSQQTELTIPDDFAPALQWIEAAVRAMPLAAPRFEVVLLAFPPESHDALAHFLSSAGVVVSLDTVPVTLASDLGVGTARTFTERLEALGASIELRKERR